jgi:hypothetical protein
MPSIPPRQQVTLARRIACGLPVWAAARGSNLPREDVGALMWQPEFRELIGAWAEIFDMSPEARKKRLELLAHAVVEEALGNRDLRTAHFVQREYRRRRDPVVTLAKGFSHIVDREQARGEREQPEAEMPPAPVPEPAPAPDPIEAAVAEAEAARRIPTAAHPDDRALWRKAGQLRHDMLGEQVLHHAVVRTAMFERLLGPPSVADLPPEPEPPPEPMLRSTPTSPTPPRTPPIPADKRAAPPAMAEMSAEDRGVMDELREMFFDLPKERLLHLFSLPPQGMEHIYAALAAEAAAQGGRLYRRPRPPT